MTVPANVSSVSYTGNGVTTAFTVTFPYLDEDDLVVKLTPLGGTETTKTNGVHYTVSPARGATGTVNFVTAPDADDAIVIERTVALTQTTAFRSQGSFSPAVHEDVMDKEMMGLQQLDRRIASLESVDSGTSGAALYSGMVAYDADVELDPPTTPTVVSMTDDASTVIAFTEIITNSGRVFDTAARFAALAAGYYQLTACLTLLRDGAVGSSNVGVYLRKNGTTVIGRALAAVTNDEYFNPTLVANVHLDLNDYVEVVVRVYGTDVDLIGGHYSTFSGHLLQADA